MNDKTALQRPGRSEPWSERLGKDTVALSYELLALLRGTPFKRQLMLLAGAIVAVVLLNAAVQVSLNAWQGNIYDAIALRDVAVFTREVLVFFAITATLLVLGVVQTWSHEMLKVRFREAISVDVLDEWLRPKRAYLLPLAGEIGSHPDQRIQDDARRMTELTVDLGVGLLQSSLLLFSFIGVLWVLSAQVVFAVNGDRFSIPGYLVWCALAYAAVGSFFVWWVGRPLIRSNTELRAEEAEFRFLLVRVDEKAEAIAVRRGGRARPSRGGAARRAGGAGYFSGKIALSLFERELAATALISIGENRDNNTFYSRIVPLRTKLLAAERAQDVGGIAASPAHAQPN